MSVKKTFLLLVSGVIVIGLLVVAINICLGLGEVPLSVMNKLGWFPILLIIGFVSFLKKNWKEI